VDPYLEFFVRYDPTCPVASLWQEAYHLRKAMLPSFISSEVASNIVLIGKSINFIRLCITEGSSGRRRAGRAGVGTSRWGSGKPTAPGSGAAERSDRVGAETGRRAGGRESVLDDSDGLSDGDGTEGVAAAVADRPAAGFRNTSVEGGVAKRRNSFTKAGVSSTVEGSRRPSVGQAVTGEVTKNTRSGRDDSLAVDDDEEGVGDIIPSELAERVRSLGYGRELELSRIATEISEITNAKLLRLMRDRYYLDDHLGALKKYLLLGQVR